MFLGNSKSECTFNDSLIANSLNLSQSGEALFYTYQKTQLLLRKKGAITTVFIQASPHELSEGWDKKIWNKKHLFEFLPRVVSVLSLEDFLPIVKNNPSELAKVFFVAAIMKNMHCCGFGNIICGRNFLGKYRWLDRDIKPKELENTKKIMSVNFAEYNILYLKKTIALLEQNNIKVILVNAPLPARYISAASTNAFNKIREESFPTIPYLDFSNFPLNNTDYADASHVNYRGAKKFSLFFNKLLEKGLLNKKEMEAFVHEEIAQLTDSTNQ